MPWLRIATYPLRVIVHIERLVAGGVGLAREDDGRVVLVRGGLPGDEVEVIPTRERNDVVHADIAAVVVASPVRVEPPCPAVAAGCGGCDLQHADLAQQADLKLEIIRDSLRRLGRVADPSVRVGPPVPPVAYRTTARCVVSDGRAGYRARASHDPVIVGRCPVAHPLVDELIAVGRFDGCTEVTLRAGARTGERLVLAEPTAAGVVVPDGVVVVGLDELRRKGGGRSAAYHEELAGRRWRISARSFFQPSPEGAEALLAVAAELAGDALGAGPLVDLYGGVGLFAGVLGSAARSSDATLPITLVERAGSSLADARHNLADLGVQVRPVAVERWRPEPAALVVADPAREGLREVAVQKIGATGAARLVLVSCDAASLGRDVALLRAEGFEPVESVLVDQFAMTSHVEVVTRFDRPRRAG
jgi:23S rRNA (uracil1939-C5)-methyltransferase